MSERKLIKWRSVAAVCAIVTAIATTFTVVTLSRAGPPTEEPPDPGLVEPQPEDRDPTPEELKALLEDVAGRVGGGLRVMADDCKSKCAQDPEYFKSVMGVLIMVCERTWPDDIRASPAYDKRLHGALLAGYDRACKMLDSASKQLGPPVQRGLWRNVMEDAARAIEEAFDADRAKGR